MLTQKQKSDNDRNNDGRYVSCRTTGIRAGDKHSCVAIVALPPIPALTFPQSVDDGAVSVAAERHRTVGVRNTDVAEVCNVVETVAGVDEVVENVVASEIFINGKTGTSLYRACTFSRLIPDILISFTELCALRCTLPSVCPDDFSTPDAVYLHADVESPHVVAVLIRGAQVHAGTSVVRTSGSSFDREDVGVLVVVVLRFVDRKRYAGIAYILDTSWKARARAVVKIVLPMDDQPIKFF